MAEANNPVHRKALGKSGATIVRHKRKRAAGRPAARQLL